jgi:nucleoid DNA-binding protein
MEDLAVFRADDPRGALLLTYSGSLLSVGPLKGEGRRIEYASIELRTDVPHLALAEAAGLAEGLVVATEARLSGGPVETTSPVLKIAACPEDVPRDEQEKRIREATIFLTNGFVTINRTLAPPMGGFPDQFTMRSVVGYLASRNGLTLRQTRQLIDDYLTVIQSGMLLGQRVPLGSLGRLFLKLRPARKARVGNNPATGQKITLPARPAEAVPRMSFSRLLKERARLTELWPKERRPFSQSDAG